MRTARLLLAAATARATVAGPAAPTLTPSTSACLTWRRAASAISTPSPDASPSPSAAAVSASVSTATSSTLVWPPPAEAFRDGGALDGLRKALTGGGEGEGVAPSPSPLRPPPSSFSARPAGQAGRALAPAPPPPPPTALLRRPYARIIAPADVAAILNAAACDDVATLDGLDARADCTFTEAMVFATARSTRHAAMAAEAVVHDLKERIAASPTPVPLQPVVEGEAGTDAWLLVDAGSVIAHVFVGPDVRAAYDVESLWRGGGQHRELEWEEDEETEVGKEDKEGGEATGPGLEK